MIVLELGSYVVPAYAGMLLAEQGHRVVKWTNPARPDPVLGLRHGEQLWAWLNAGKTLIDRHARDVAELPAGTADAVIDNIRAEAWTAWGVDPAEQARRLGVPWVSMRDDFDGRSFDAIAQARAWGDHLGWQPAYLGDTTGGLWLAFKLLAHRHRPGHHVLRQAGCLAKLVEGELVVPVDRDGKSTPWDEPGTYGPDPTGAGVQVLYRGELVREPYRDAAWRWRHLAHAGGRFRV